MARVILLHGKPDEDEYFDDTQPSVSNSHWFPWLQKELIVRGHSVQTPEVLNSYLPVYDTWRDEFERNVTGEPLMLVGHSCGGGFLLRWLSENTDAKVQKLVLVAPWLDPGKTLTTCFFDFELDAALAERVGVLHLFNSADDADSIQTSVAMIVETVTGIVVHQFENMGHFCMSDMGTDQFPELRDVLID